MMIFLRTSPFSSVALLILKITLSAQVEKHYIRPSPFTNIPSKELHLGTDPVFLQKII